MASAVADRVAALGARLAVARAQLERETGQAQAIAAEGRKATAELAALKAQAELHQQVTALLTQAGESAELSAQEQVEELVTRALQVIFADNLAFRLVRSVKGSQASLEFVLRTRLPDGSEMDTPVLEARGGGMAVVVAFVLRLVVLLLTPGARRLLVLDETFGHVSAAYEGRLAEFLREVADKAGVQVLLVTHSHAYSDLADKRYRLRQGADGTTALEETDG